MSDPGCWESGLQTAGLVQGRLAHRGHPVHQGGHWGQAGTDKDPTGRVPWEGSPVRAGTTPEAGTACHQTDQGQDRALQRGPNLPYAVESNRNPERRVGDLAGSEDRHGQSGLVDLEALEVPGVPEVLEVQLALTNRERHCQAVVEPDAGTLATALPRETVLFFNKWI